MVATEELHLRRLLIGVSFFVLSVPLSWSQDPSASGSPTPSVPSSAHSTLIAPEDDLGLMEAPPIPPPEAPTQAEASSSPQPSPPAPVSVLEDAGESAETFEKPVTQPAPQESPATSSELADQLDLPKSLVEEVKQDPFSYLGNIRYEDIYVVQKMYARKDGRYYVAAVGGGGNFFSQFHTTLANGFSAGYYFSDLLGWEVFHGLFAHTFTNQRHDMFLNKFELWAGRIELRVNYILSSALIFSPFYGKFAFFGNRVLHYDIYGIGGPAFVFYQEATVGYGGVLGAGFRVFMNKWSSLGLEFRDYIYVEPIPPIFGASFIGGAGSQIASKFFLFLNFTVYFPKFAFMDEV